MNVFAVSCVVMAFTAPLACASAVYVNSDAWNFFSDNELKDRGAIAAAIDADVDFYADAGATAVFYNLNAQRALFGSKTATPLWKDVSVGEDGRPLLRGKPFVTDQDGRRILAMANRAHRVSELMPDFIARRYARCRARGVEMWHSMRMNDIHYTYLGSEWIPLHSDMWLDRKDLLRAWYRHSWRGEWRDNGFDYAKREVLDAHLALMREYLLGYESDGIELDWMRCVPLFAPGHDESNAHVLTHFMRETRKTASEAAAKWGHPVKIAVRVPARVREAYGVGMDIATWVREGLVDVVVPSPRDTSTEMDCDVALYRAICPKPIVLAPDVDYYCRSSDDKRYVLAFSADIDRGFVSGWYHDGADAAYLYNHFPRHAKERHDGYPAYIASLGDREALARMPRRHVFTSHAPIGEGVFPSSPYWNAVWRNCCNGCVKVNCGEGVSGRRAVVVIGAKTSLDVDVIVNSVKCAPVSLDSVCLKDLPEAKEGDTLCYVAAVVPPGVLHDGWNGVEIFNRGPVDLKSRDFVWLEVKL